MCRLVWIRRIKTLRDNRNNLSASFLYDLNKCRLGSIAMDQRFANS